MIDEIDRAAPKERSAILYQLASLEKVGVAAISYGHRPFLELDSQVRSRLHPTLIEFHPYATPELQAILARRAEIALLPDTWDSTLLAKIAELSEGNARVALHALRNAAYRAERERNATVQIHHLDESLDAIRNLKKKLTLDSLTPHDRLLHEIVTAAKQITSGDLRRIYVKNARPGIRSL